MRGKLTGKGSGTGKAQIRQIDRQIVPRQNLATALARLKRDDACERALHFTLRLQFQRQRLLPQGHKPGVHCHHPLQGAPRIAERPNDLMTPERRHGPERAHVGLRKGIPLPSGIKTEQYKVDLHAVCVLKTDQLLGDTRTGIKIQRETPQTGGKCVSIPHPLSLPLLRGSRQARTALRPTMEMTWLMTEHEEKELGNILAQLKEEHRDLDSAIKALQALAMNDELQIKRMKKRKLALRDRIQGLEDILCPDIIA